MESNYFVEFSYLIAAMLFVYSMKQMSSPVTAKKGVQWAGWGMILATIATFFVSGMGNFAWIVLALLIGAGIAYWSAKTVKMTDMPQMIAIYNGMGGGAAAAIAAVEFSRVGGMTEVHVAHNMLAAAGAIIGAVAFSGSCVAFAKLQGLMKKTFSLPSQNIVNIGLIAAAVILGLVISFYPSLAFLVVIFFVVALLFGVLVTTPIGGADMPVVISLYNALTGLAVAMEGFVLDNPTMIIAGTVVGASGSLLTQLMAKAMNRPISNILFKPITGEAQGGAAITGSMKELSATDVAALMRYAEKVVIVPGYGMAVANAQHKVWEMGKILEGYGVEVKFAIHPVAGRMPGHMNVLLAEAGVPYDKIFDLEEINPEFPMADVCLVIGANDVVNPVARTDKSSPIYGMPILDADKAKNVVIVKRGRGTGYSGIDNALFYLENSRMLYGDAQPVANDLITHLKALSE
jgi:NAD(P) transhydrogenase subunit beta